MVMKPNKFLCCMFFLGGGAFIGFDRAQTTIDFEMCLSNWPIESFKIFYCSGVV